MHRNEWPGRQTGARAQKTRRPQSHEFLIKYQSQCGQQACTPWRNVKSRQDSGIVESDTGATVECENSPAGGQTRRGDFLFSMARRRIANEQQTFVARPTNTNRPSTTGIERIQRTNKTNAAKLSTDDSPDHLSCMFRQYSPSYTGYKSSL